MHIIFHRLSMIFFLVPAIQLLRMQVSPLVIYHSELSINVWANDTQATQMMMNFCCCQRFAK